MCPVFVGRAKCVMGCRLGLRVEETPGPWVYDARYYGHGPEPPTANYRGYGEPHWARPLAHWLVERVGQAPYLDVGAAFGYLTRELARLGVEAWAVEWSAYATARAATDRMVRADGRRLPFRDGAFGTVVSMDYLEHFTPVDTIFAVEELHRVCRPGGMQVHLIGWHHPRHDLDRHLSDPTHRNHASVRWYLNAFTRLGYAQDKALSRAINLHPLWRDTDWRGRWVVWRRDP